MQFDYAIAKKILEKSTILFKKETLHQRISDLAHIIEQEIHGTIPVFLTVMNGGMFFANDLLRQIQAPFICDYIHASRYGDNTLGGMHITWYHQPKIEDIKDKVVYIIDDILDEGHTLAEVVRFLKQAGATQCKIVVLVDKDLGKAKPIQADHVGLTAPNHFLFGYGMDIEGLYRQLSNIYIYNAV